MMSHLTGIYQNVNDMHEMRSIKANMKSREKVRTEKVTA